MENVLLTESFLGKLCKMTAKIQLQEKDGSIFLAEKYGFLIDYDEDYFYIGKEENIITGCVLKKDILSLEIIDIDLNDSKNKEQDYEMFAPFDSDDDDGGISN